MKRVKDFGVIDFANPTADGLVAFAHLFEEEYEVRVTDYILDVIPGEVVESMIKQKLSFYGWESAVRLTWNIDRLDQDYYLMQGDGNLRNLTERDIQIRLDDIIGQAGKMIV